MRARSLLLSLPAMLLLAAHVSLPAPAGAQQSRNHFDFEDGVHGFTAIRMKDGAVGADPDAGLTALRDKNLARAGEGALSYSYRTERGAMAALICDLRLPAGTRSIRVSLRSDARTALLLTVREMDGSSYQTAFTLPAGEWTDAGANLDELAPEENATDENGKLDPDQVASVSFFDLSGMIATAADPVLVIADFRPERRLLVDELYLSPETLPASRGPARSPEGSFVVVDNFEGRGIRWLPVRVQLADPPAFQLFPSEAKLELLREAAGPGMARTAVEPGGKGLRVTYQRGERMAFGFNTSCRGLNLAGADRLLISTNLSRPSLLIIQVKEQDDSEYNFTVLPDGSVGWTNRVLEFDSFSLADNSKDENNRLDPDQIKEMTILDASAFLMGQVPGGEVVLELDAIAFGIKGS